MVLIIIVNLTLIVQIYFFKEELPDIFGAFPLIFLNDAGTPLVQNGDFVICQKIDDENISYLKEGDIVTHFADVGHTKLLEQIRTIDKKRLLHYVGRIDKQSALSVERASLASLGIDIYKTYQRLYT